LIGCRSAASQPNESTNPNGLPVARIQLTGMIAIIAKGFRILRNEGLKGISSRLRRTGACADGFDEAHGIETGTPIPIWRMGSLKNLSESSPYQAITIETFEEMLLNLPLRAEEYSFIDLGCGKGKALILALEHGFKEAIGVEFFHELCAASMRNLGKLGMRDKSQVMWASAAEYNFPEVPSVVFMFNPFGPLVMKNVLAHLRPGTFLVYAHPKHAEMIRFPLMYRSANVGIWQKS
jgi:SAM-dependent methyltransferase